MVLLNESESFFDFLGPVGDGPTFMPVSAPPPPYQAPPSIQPIAITEPNSPSYSPIIDGDAPWSVPTYYPSFSPPAPETFYFTPPNPLDVINLGTRTDPVYVPRGLDDDRGLDDIVGQLGSTERSPSLAVTPLPQPISRPRATFQSLLDIDSSTSFDSPSASSSGSMVLPLLALVAALALLD